MKVWNAVCTILVCALAALALLLAGIRLAGVTPYAVLSGSMSPAYPTGALIYVKPVQPQQVSVGDPITFRLNGVSAVATHRVVRIDDVNQCFFTKGDANASPDGEPVGFNRLIGTPVFSIPLLGYVSNFISAPPGLYIVITAAFVILALTVLSSHLRKKISKDTAEREKARQTLVRRTRRAIRASEKVN